MNDDAKLMLVVLFLFILAGLYIYKKKKSKKKKKNTTNPTAPVTPKNPVPGINIVTEGNTNANNFIAGMRVIKKGNKEFYDNIVNKTMTVTIMPGFKVINGEINKKWMAEAPLNGNWIKFYAGSMAIYEKKYNTTHLWARVITHEYGHLIGFSHDTKAKAKMMEAWVIRNVKSFGGKVLSVS